MEIIHRAQRHPARFAVISDDRAYTYGELLAASEQIARILLKGRPDLAEARIAMMVPPGFDYVSVQWGIWRAGGMAVPLALSYPAAELRYVIETTTPEVIIAAPGYLDQLRPIADDHGVSLLPTDEMISSARPPLPEIHSSRGALILFTSGTTSKPKGVIITHHNLEAQVTCLTEAWGWQPDDHILNVLPLYHVHGITNILTTALWNGALCEFLPKFEATAVWSRLGSSELTLFMAVPTIYAKLIQHYEAQPPSVQVRWTDASMRMRLMVSGSAALPVTILERWETMTGQRLLERYGMTEIGMALSNPLKGERRAGHVGRPLPGVEIRLVNNRYQDVSPGESGEIMVRSANVFREYWNRPEATAEAFIDGWFRTGDMAIIQNGYYRILGRSSVDILKSGGYKLSALEIEEVFRTHPALRDVAVVGLPDETYGQIVALAATVQSAIPEPDEILVWAKDKLAPYKLPRKITFVAELPRNALGKVVKPRVNELF
ncbi:MAG: acyl-CoA synthetase [Bacteroidota bacterium]